VLLFLEHKNSEPAMKILMRNVGMTLHVIHTLRAQGIDNVKVNMDWQHLLMSGENLAEYAALLAAEGLLGHQHANSGWGTFDDDNMVGTTAFMETLEAVDFPIRVADNDLAAAQQRQTEPFTEIGDHLVAVDTEPGLQGARLIVDSGMQYVGIVAGLLIGNHAALLDHANRGAWTHLLDVHRGGETDESAADNQYLRVRGHRIPAGTPFRISQELSTPRLAPASACARL